VSGGERRREGRKEGREGEKTHDQSSLTSEIASIVKFGLSLPDRFRLLELLSEKLVLHLGHPTSLESDRVERKSGPEVSSSSSLLSSNLGSNRDSQMSFPSQPLYPPSLLLVYLLYHTRFQLRTVSVDGPVERDEFGTKGQG